MRAKDKIMRAMLRKRFCLRIGSFRCSSHVCESSLPISGPIYSSSKYAVDRCGQVGLEAY
jgi:hypothetical protein